MNQRLAGGIFFDLFFERFHSGHFGPHLRDPAQEFFTLGVSFLLPVLTRDARALFMSRLVHGPLL